MNMNFLFCQLTNKRISLLDLTSEAPPVLRWNTMVQVMAKCALYELSRHLDRYQGYHTEDL